MGIGYVVMGILIALLVFSRDIDSFLRARERPSEGARGGPEKPDEQYLFASEDDVFEHDHFRVGSLHHDSFNLDDLFGR